MIIDPNSTFDMIGVGVFGLGLVVTIAVAITLLVDRLRSPGVSGKFVAGQRRTEATFSVSISEDNRIVVAYRATTPGQQHRQPTVTTELDDLDQAMAFVKDHLSKDASQPPAVR